MSGDIEMALEEINASEASLLQDKL